MPLGPDERLRPRVEVYVCAPLQSDAAMITNVLAEEGIEATELGPAETAELHRPGALLVCTQEGLTHALLNSLLAIVSEQPAWASFPLLLLLDATQDAAAVAARLGPLVADGLVTVLHRPVRPLEFRTAVTNAVAARLRQLELSDHLQLQLELRHELNHRVKNTVATIQAIYRLTLRQSQSLEEFQEKFTGRLGALSKVHELLYDTKGPQPVLRQLANAMIAPYGGSGERIEVEGENLAIDRDHALTVALTLNELATNASKYGALQEDEGRIALSWHAEAADATLHLAWREQTERAVQKPQKEGYGTRFITSSVASLGGTTAFAYEPTGLNFEMKLPLG